MNRTRPNRGRRGPHIRLCRAGGPVWSITVQVTVAILTLAIPAATPAENSAPVFRAGFSRSLFTDVNDSDARAAIRVWAQTVARERNINMDPTAGLFDDPAEMVSAMRQGAVDVMSTNFDEFLEISMEVETSDWFATVTASELFEEYIVLVHSDNGVSSLVELKGQSVILHDTARSSLALDWLDHLVIGDGFGAGAEEFFGTIKRVDKVSSAVLPVFFGQAVAGVVAESSFETMCELNPQLRRQLLVIAKSPRLLPAILFFRRDFESPEKERIMEALSNLHSTAAGQQVLTLFKSEALVPVDEQPLKETENFLRETRRQRDLLDPTDGTPAGPPAAALEPTHE